MSMACYNKVSALKQLMTLFYLGIKLCIKPRVILSAKC